MRLLSSLGENTYVPIRHRSNLAFDWVAPSNLFGGVDFQNSAGAIREI